MTKDNSVIGYKFFQKTYTYEEFYFKSKKDGERKYIYRGIVKLFRNHQGIQFIYPVHESVVPSIRRSKGRIADSGISIDHFGRLGDKVTLRNKDIYYVELLKKKIQKFPLSSSYIELGMQYLSLEDYKNALDAFNHAYELNPENSNIINYFKKTKELLN